MFKDAKNKILIQRQPHENEGKGRGWEGQRKRLKVHSSWWGHCWDFLIMSDKPHFQFQLITWADTNSVNSRKHTGAHLWWGVGGGGRESSPLLPAESCWFRYQTPPGCCQLNVPHTHSETSCLVPWAPPPPPVWASPESAPASPSRPVPERRRSWGA